MKFIVVIMLLALVSISVCAQSETEVFRIKKIKFSEGIGDGYTAEYFYDDSGRVTRVLWEYVNGQTRHFMGERKMLYSNDFIVCTYLPDEFAKHKFLVKNYYFKNINAGDVDSILSQDGKVHQVVQLRNNGSQAHATRYKFSYSASGFLLSETIMKESDTVVRTFQYKHGVLTKAGQQSKALKMQVSADQQNPIDSLIVIFKTHDVPRGEVYYTCEYNGNLLRTVRETGTSNAYFFEWDDSSTKLTCLSKRDETGSSSVCYEYEEGSGNAATFQRDRDLIDYFFPRPGW